MLKGSTELGNDGIKAKEGLRGDRPSRAVVWLGLGESENLLHALKKSADKDLHFLIEPDETVSNDLLRRLKSEGIKAKVALASGKSDLEVLEEWEEIFDLTSTEEVDFRSSRGGQTAFLDRCRALIEGHVLRESINLRTQLKKGKDITLNVIRNLAGLVDMPGASLLAEQITGGTALVLGAGPSLDRILPYLEYGKKKAILIAVDTVVSTLNGAGIEPDLIVTSDPFPENRVHLRHQSHLGSPVLLHPAMDPEFVKEFTGKSLLYALENPLADFLLEGEPDVPFLSSWGSVSIVAVDLAIKLGCEKILLGGLDLAFTDGRSYCSGVAPGELSFFSCCQEVGAPVTPNGPVLSDIFGRKIHSSESLVGYCRSAERSWNRSKVEIINCSEGGILKEGLPSRKIDSQLHLEPARSRPLELPVSIDKERGKRITRRVETLRDRLDALGKKLARLIAKDPGIGPEEILKDREILRVIESMNQREVLNLKKATAGGGGSNRSDQHLEELFVSFHASVKVLGEYSEN
jgi:hypothetical protein